MRWNAPEDFQSYSPVRVSARNCLMWNTRLPTASCAGVRWNDQECARVGHIWGTLDFDDWMISSARTQDRLRDRVSCPIARMSSSAPHAPGRDEEPRPP